MAITQEPVATIILSGKPTEEGLSYDALFKDHEFLDLALPLTSLEKDIRVLKNKKQGFIDSFDRTHQEFYEEDIKPSLMLLNAKQLEIENLQKIRHIQMGRGRKEKDMYEVDDSGAKTRGFLSFLFGGTKTTYIRNKDSHKECIAIVSKVPNLWQRLWGKNETVERIEALTQEPHDLLLMGRMVHQIDEKYFKVWEQLQHKEPKKTENIDDCIVGNDEMRQRINQGREAERNGILQDDRVLNLEEQTKQIPLSGASIRTRKSYVPHWRRQAAPKQDAQDSTTHPKPTNEGTKKKSN